MVTFLILGVLVLFIALGLPVAVALGLTAVGFLDRGLEVVQVAHLLVPDGEASRLDLPDRAVAIRLVHIAEQGRQAARQRHVDRHRFAMPRIDHVHFLQIIVMGI